jgi:hypothetical protein
MSCTAASAAATGRPNLKFPAMGLKAGRNLDNIQELLAQADGEDFR